MTSEMSSLLKGANLIVEEFRTRMIYGHRTTDGWLEMRIYDALKEAERDTWLKAMVEVETCAFRCSEESKEGYYCYFDLMGLACDFKANADGSRVPDADREKK